MKYKELTKEQQELAIDANRQIVTDNDGYLTDWETWEDKLKKLGCSDIDFEYYGFMNGCSFSAKLNLETFTNGKLKGECYLEDESFCEVTMDEDNENETEWIDTITEKFDKIIDEINTACQSLGEEQQKDENVINELILCEYDFDELGEIKNRNVDIYLHGIGENGHLNKEDFGADSIKIEKVNP